ncbi:hypothetical protein niasHT_027408 [Heterodera trifolii]|uniref:Uncharacterized protein n=1 Tax=Heterodera trifolii TaxID=157864 RepID=A0ABD2JTX3_9BILA
MLRPHPLLLLFLTLSFCFCAVSARRQTPPRAHSLSFIFQQSKRAAALDKQMPLSAGFSPAGAVLPRPLRPTLSAPSPPSVPRAPLKCSLPSEFWCDHPEIELLCTGSTHFCEAYKANQKGKGVEMKLAFESGCPDSQKLIVDRLFPRVLDNPSLSGMVDFKAIPWGLAKRRQSDHQVQCHHGANECAANRLLSCALKHPYSDKSRRHRLLNCFMAKMMSKSEPENAMISCLAKSGLSRNEILNCAQTDAVTLLQLEDEKETEHILNSPRFVPFVSLNGWSHLALQAPAQLLLTEKLAHWNDTLNGVSIYKRSALKSLPTPYRSCALPPDFWCSSDSSVTGACFDEQKCRTFQRSLYGIPVQLKVIYDSQLSASRDYLRRFVRPQFFSGTRAQRYAQNAGKVHVELEPAAMTQSKIGECVGTATTAQCQRRILEICVFAAFVNAEQRSVQLMCINDIERWKSADDIVTVWQRNCYPAKKQREQIRFCVSSDAIWRQANARLGLAQFGALWPEQQRTDPWVVLNGLSLSTVQRYSLVLDQLVCLWYRGPGHDPTECGRCEYEPTHC